MTESTKSFNPAHYKETTLQQWEAAAEPWHRWHPLLTSWLGGPTEQMLDMASVTKGSHVLDVAAGAGDQSMQVAARVGASGRVLATDLSPSILTYAAKRAQESGYSQLETLAIDGEKLDELEANSFDAVISRVGMIYFPDQQKALRGMMHALKPGGKVAAMVYGTADKNGFFAEPVGIIRRRAQLPPPLAGQPGPFSLGGEGVLAAALTEAGFKEVQVAVIDAPVCVATAKECLDFEKESFGALHQMLSGLDDAGKAEAWQEIEDKLTEYEGPDGFCGPCELVVAVGTKV